MGEKNEGYQEARKISEQVQVLADEFVDFYESRGYKSENSVSITSNIDPTVLFIGASISVLRKYLHEGVPSMGVTLVQPCLRTWNKESFYDNDRDIEYNSFFTMCSVLMPPNTERKVCEDAMRLLTNVYAIDSSKIAIRTTRSDVGLYSLALSSGLDEARIIIDDRPSNYYRWTYGQEQVTGRGVTFALCKSDGEFHDIGNIITIENGNVPVAVEWGFGVETLLSRLEDLKHPLEASQISNFIPYAPGNQGKLADAMMAILEMYSAGVSPGRSGHRSILKQYLKGASYLCKQLGISPEEICSLVEGYSPAGEAHSGVSWRRILEDINKYEQMPVERLGRVALR